MGVVFLTFPEGLATGTTVEGKFLQLRFDGRDYLLFATATEHGYHNQILARFLSEHGIRHAWVDGYKLVVDCAGLRVTGGGRFRLDPERKTLRVWDESSVYGRFDASGLVAQFSAAEAPWNEFKLEFN